MPEISREKQHPVISERDLALSALHSVYRPLTREPNPCLDQAIFPVDLIAYHNLPLAPR